MQPELLDLSLKHGRYAWEAYDFVLSALTHAQRMFGKDVLSEGELAGPEHHVTGRELLEGVCDLGRREFGLMAPVVFQIWGIHRTDDVGAIVFDLIEAGVLSKTDNDRPEDFHEAFDLETTLTENFPILSDQDALRSLR